MARRYEKSSFYGLTPIKSWYLDLLVQKNIPNGGNETVYTIPNKFNKRPDLASQLFYGTPKYWYVFALRNKKLLVDPVNDFVAGITILVPNKDDVG